MGNNANARGGSGHIRVLIDTNILIQREDDRVIEENLASLLRVMSENNVPYLVHPKSIKELKRDRDDRRRDIMRSKLQAYSLLESPPDPKQDTTPTWVRLYQEREYEVDDHLLYCVYRDAVDLLITEDKGIHRKARRLEVQDRVLTISEADAFVWDLYEKATITSPPAISEVPVNNIDETDPFFNSLREKYDDFDDWLTRTKRKGRKCWLHRCDDGSIGALLIFKEEEEPIPCIPPLPSHRRMKLCTFKVSPSQWGKRIGELFLRLAVEFCIKREIDEMYLTHFVEDIDRMVELIEDIGFRYVGDTKRGEKVFLKRLTVRRDALSEVDPAKIVQLYYPTFYDGRHVKKFIIPIQPEYHERLFTDFQKRQTQLPEFGGEFVVEGNTIKKAYICHSSIKQMQPGSIVLFYRSDDLKSITSIGIIDVVHRNMRTPERVRRLVRKRTVYSEEEIDKMVTRPTLVILFKHLFHLTTPFTLSEMLRMGISSPQSIREISENDYSRIREAGGIDERYTVH